MLFAVIGSVLLFLVLAVVPGWSIATRVQGTPLERLLVSAVASLLLGFSIGWTTYVAGLPHGAVYAWPGLALLTLILQRRSLADLLRDGEVRAVLIGQVLVTTWTVAWLSLVVSYSGGNWVADWFGHWQRTMFFLERPSPHVLFNGFDPLPSRPPLANVLTAAMVTLTNRDFAHYQLASTVLASLAFLPAAVLLRRLRPDARPGMLALLLLVSPMFVQNATYPWTKLPAAFFVLTATYGFLRSLSPAAPSWTGVLFSVALAGAILTHYSAGPYAVFFALAWFGCNSHQLRDRAWWKQSLGAAAAGLAVLGLWFGWAFQTYGWRGALLSNTSVTDQAPTASAQLLTILLNIRDTLVPHFLRPLDPGWLLQAHPWGRIRDWWFHLYQTNLFFAFGATAWVVLAAVLWHRARRAEPRERRFWIAFVLFNVALGIAVHGSRGELGLAHICLQPLVLLGAIVLAGAGPTLSPPLRGLLMAGALVDLSCGILLQFGIQSFLLDAWLNPAADTAATLQGYSLAANINLNAKRALSLVFLGDRPLAAASWSVLILTLTAVLAVLHAAGFLSRTAASSKQCRPNQA